MNLSTFLIRMGKVFQTFISFKLLVIFIRYRVLASSEHRFLFSIPFATIIDVGANRGQFALAARRWGQNDARIISFEPQEVPANIFRNIFINDQYVSIHQFAVGEKSAEISLHISKKDDSSSLREISDMQSRLYPGTEEESLIKTQMHRLDFAVSNSDLRSPALLKLDVQGYEYESLLGCESLITQFDFIYCECSFLELYLGQKLVSDVIEWLSQRGFVLCGVFNTSYSSTGQSIQADFLFKK